MNGMIDSVYIWNGTLTEAQIQTVNASTTGYPFSTPPAPAQRNFTVFAHDWLQNKKISQFNITWNGTTYFNGSGGNVTMPFYTNATQTRTFTINSNGYVSVTKTNHNISANLNQSMTNATTQNLNINVFNWLGTTQLGSITLWNNWTTPSYTGASPYQESLASYLDYENQTRSVL